MPYPGHLDTCSGVCLLMLFIKNSLTHSDQAGTLLPSYWNLLSCEGKLGILKSKGPESKSLVLVCFSTFLVLGRDLFFFLSVIYWTGSWCSALLIHKASHCFIEGWIDRLIHSSRSWEHDGQGGVWERGRLWWHSEEAMYTVTWARAYQGHRGGSDWGRPRRAGEGFVSEVSIYKEEPR